MDERVISTMRIILNMIMSIVDRFMDLISSNYFYDTGYT
jgi:hypothetical protein